MSFNNSPSSGCNVVILMLMNSMKRQNDRILKEKLPRSVGDQISTDLQMLLEISGEITPERMKGWSQSKKNTLLWM